MRKAMLMLACLLAACGGGDAPTTPGNGGGDGGGGGGGGGGGPTLTATVSVVDNAFSPSTVTILRTGTVTWRWNSGYAYSTPHNVTFSDDESNDQSEGTWSKSFPTVGTFNYSCTNHQGMNGTVIVQ
jgi:plastocyanin